jgi:multicomponent Na+:H+ antiporter subunit D
MYGIGKAALMPMHRWLPAAMVAPTPVSALLHAVAVVKAGVFSVVKVIIYTFGPLTLISSTTRAAG